METESQLLQKKSKNQKSKRNIAQIVILALILVIISGGAGYFAGFQYGKKEGARLAVKKVTDIINPLNAVSNNPLFPSTIVGKVSAIDKKEIKVKTPNGEEKTIPLSDKTKVTKGSASLSLKEVTKDSSVTIVATGKDKDFAATRIIIK